MNLDAAKRVVAIQRSIAAYNAMAKRGDLTAEECAVLVAGLQAELVRLRSQAELPLDGKAGKK